MSDSTVAVIDCETFGLESFQPEWEWAIIVDGEEHCWQQKITEGQLALANPYALEITKFYERYDDSTALTPKESAERFAILIDSGDPDAKRHWVGAVPSFDEQRMRRLFNSFISGNLYNVDFPWHYHLIDVETMMIGYLKALRHVYQDTPLRNSSEAKEMDEILKLPWKSHALSEAFEIITPVEDEHTALGDARWAALIWDKLTA